MSAASVRHPTDIHSSHNSLITTLSNRNLTKNFYSLNYISNHSAETAFLTIEELRDQLNCCFTCGVSWSDNHVSLDCCECGGYGMERPCLKCDGRCGSIWKRDLSGSHSNGKSYWNGECKKIDIQTDNISISTSQDRSSYRTTS